MSARAPRLPLFARCGCVLSGFCPRRGGVRAEDLADAFGGRVVDALPGLGRAAAGLVGVLAEDALDAFGVDPAALVAPPELGGEFVGVDAGGVDFGAEPVDRDAAHVQPPARHGRSNP
jgi:hypothetical protein